MGGCALDGTRCRRGGRIDASALRRTMLAMTVVLVFTRCRQFARVMYICGLSLSACAPFLSTMLVIMMLYSLICRDLFSTIPGDKYFANFGKALTTTFRLFVGEGWHYIMYDTAITSNATKFSSWPMSSAPRSYSGSSFSGSSSHSTAR